MGRRGQPPPVELKELRGQLDHWRSNRTGRNVPGEFWKAAVEFAKVHGVSRVAQGLGLNYGALRRRLDKAQECSVAGPEGKSAFVEVELGTVGSQETECVVELEDRKKGKMTIRLRGTSGVDVAALAATFWKRR